VLLTDVLYVITLWDGKLQQQQQQQQQKNQTSQKTQYLQQHCYGNLRFCSYPFFICWEN